jgi:hypothetical protein
VDAVNAFAPYCRSMPRCPSSFSVSWPRCSSQLRPCCSVTLPLTSLTSLLFSHVAPCNFDFVVQSHCPSQLRLRCSVTLPLLATSAAQLRWHSLALAALLPGHVTFPSLSLIAILASVPSLSATADISLFLSLRSR